MLLIPFSIIMIKIFGIILSHPCSIEKDGEEQKLWRNCILLLAPLIRLKKFLINIMRKYPLLYIAFCGSLIFLEI